MKRRRYFQRLFHFARSSGILFAQEKVSIKYCCSTLRWCYTGDLQRRFLTQHIISRLLRHCFEWLQHCSNIAALCCAKSRRCESSRVKSPLEKLLRNTLVFYIVCYAAKSESILVLCRWKKYKLIIETKLALVPKHTGIWDAVGSTIVLVCTKNLPETQQLIDSTFFNFVQSFFWLPGGFCR